jgi:hypothetical protein
VKQELSVKMIDRCLNTYIEVLRKLIRKEHKNVYNNTINRLSFMKFREEWNNIKKFKNETR